MKGLPRIGVTGTSRISTDVFGGFHDALRIADGEWNWTENLSTRHYPMLSNRGPRGSVRQLIAPGGLLEKDALAFVDNGTLYYNGLPTGLTDLSVGEKQMVSMGAYLCIWPDKKYFNTADFTDFGSMEADYSSIGNVEFKMCRSDGSEYETVTRGADAPAQGSCDVWIDTSGSSPAAMEWSSSEGGWTLIPAMFTKLCFRSMGAIPSLFRTFDGVSISGADFDDANGEKVIYSLGGSEESNDWIVVVGMLEEEITQTEGRVRIQRKIPQMDFVIECQNRLWGCFYGNDGEQNLNEIYCSALGDFRNWRQYQGLSTDSWAASVGSDGQWTGAVNYLGHPVFFKENVIHRVTVSSVGAHQIDETNCRGVQKGSWRSLQVVNETLYYKSRIDVCAWQGGFPETASEALGDKRYFNAAAGAFGGRYYISMRDENNAWSLFCLDISKGVWMREDALHALCFAKVDDELYCVDAASKELLALNGTAGTLESIVEWQAVSGIQYYEYPDKKYVSRFNIRLSMDEGASVTIYLQYDSNGKWIPSGLVRKTGTGTVTIPFRPRRCDHMQIKLQGRGNARIFSIARILEVSSDR